MQLCQNCGERPILALGRCSACYWQHRRIHGTMQRTHCRHGHELTAENVWFKDGAKRCRLCQREAQRNSQRRKRGLAAPPADPRRSEVARLGGQKTAQDRQHMAEIGKKGGQLGGRVAAIR